MRNLNLNLAILFLTSLFFFACGNTENNTEKVENSEKNTETTVVEKETIENDTKTVENVEAVKANDFEDFWTNFQTMIANDDKKGLVKICNNQSMKDFINGNYESHVTKEMKEVIAKTKASEVKVINKTNKLISYSVEYEHENNEDAFGETFSSSFGFIFEKKDGKWWLSEPHMAG